MNDLLKIAKSLQDNNIKEADAVVYYTETLDFISKSDLEEEKVEIKQEKSLDEIEQETVGEIVPNIEERKAEFVTLHNELRVLLGKEQRLTKSSL